MTSLHSPGGEIKGPAVAEPGTTIEVEVQGDSPEIEVGLSGDGTTTKYPVPPSKRVTVPVPPGSAGRRLLITTTGTPPHGGISIPILVSLR